MRCVWVGNDECSGAVKERSFFRDNIMVPVCERHAKMHDDIMWLHRKGHDIEELLKMSMDQRTSLRKNEEKVGDE